MITNDRQYKITKAQLKEFEAALDGYSVEHAIERGEHPALAKAGLDQLKSEVDNLKSQLREYEELSSGSIQHLEALSLHDLPLMLIKARIARGWTQKELARTLGIKEQQVQRYEADLYSTARLVTLLQVADALGLEVSEQARLMRQDDSETATSAHAYPVAEMYKRGWFSDFSGTLREARRNASRLLESFFREVDVTEDFAALHRKRVRSDSSVDTHALTAWQIRMLALGRRQKLAREFDQTHMSDNWFRELSRLSQDTNGPVLAREWLLNTGIHFLVEPHLPGTYLDGAALRDQWGSPIVAMTLRHDRIDNFWFVLFHELAHIKLHLNDPGPFEFFDDLDSEAQDLEQEADEYALDRLIPEDQWNSCLSRFSLDLDMVYEEARQMGVHPAILAGRIRYEQGNFAILTEALGYGQVRRLFESEDLLLA